MLGLAAVFFLVDSEGFCDTWTLVGTDLPAGEGTWEGLKGGGAIKPGWCWRRTCSCCCGDPMGNEVFLRVFIMASRSCLDKFK